MNISQKSQPAAAFHPCCGRRTQLNHARNCPTLAPAPTNEPAIESDDQCHPFTVTHDGATLHVSDREYGVQNTIELDSEERAVRVAAICRISLEVRGAVAVYARVRSSSNSEAVKVAVERYRAGVAR